MDSRDYKACSLESKKNAVGEHEHRLAVSVEELRVSYIFYTPKKCSVNAQIKIENFVSA